MIKRGDEESFEQEARRDEGRVVDDEKERWKVKIINIRSGKTITLARRKAIREDDIEFDQETEDDQRKNVWEALKKKKSLSHFSLHLLLSVGCCFGFDRGCRLGKKTRDMPVKMRTSS